VQFSDLSVPPFKKDCILPVSGVVVIDQSSELCDVCTQSDVLGAAPHGRFPNLCLPEFGTAAMMLVKRL
jgi:hypothetical protein